MGKQVYSHVLKVFRNSIRRLSSGVVLISSSYFIFHRFKFCLLKNNLRNSVAFGTEMLEPSFELP